MTRTKMVIALVSLWILFVGAGSASASPCEINIGGSALDLFGNPVWNVPDYIYVGDYGNDFDCWVDAQGAVAQYTYDVCLFKPTAAYLDFLGDVYFDGGYVNGWSSPTTCWNDFGLNNYAATGWGYTFHANDTLPVYGSPYRLIYKSDGNLAVQLNGSDVWSIGYSGSAGSAVMYGNGELVVYDGSSTPIWSSGTAGNTNAFLALFENGYLGIFSPSGDVLWSPF